MTTKSQIVAWSKWLSWALRHDPTAAGLTLDQAGWTSVDAVLAAAELQSQAMTRADLDQVVATSDKKRFAYSEDRKSIRANQGHSVPVDLGLAPQTPPLRLFHGTAARFVQQILREGLQRQARHHVHLTGDPTTAATVGSRHGNPLVLEVDAHRMHDDGHVFYCSDNGVWLVEAVPPRYLSQWGPHGTD